MHEKVSYKIDQVYYIIYPICRERAEFEKKGVDKDVIDLRFKHYQGRLIDTLNRVIEQRRSIKMEQAR